MDELSKKTKDSRGVIAWMVGNRVTPNILMLVLLLGGFLMSLRIKKEVFPDFELDEVEIAVAFPGSSPEEVERGIILSIEESIRGLEGIKEITAKAQEGRATVTAELYDGVNREKIVQDIQQEVNRIRTFPEDAEEPEVVLTSRRRQVVEMQVYGDVSEWALTNAAQEVRDMLLQEEGITQVELRGVRSYEVRVEIAQGALRQYHLTLDAVAQKIAENSVEVSGGGVKTRTGEILLRVQERKDWAAEVATIPIITTSQGVKIALGEIAEVYDGFEDANRLATFNGKPSVELVVYRTGEETPIGISETVRGAMERIETFLPEGISYVINQDRSELYQQRLQLLLKNALIGLLLVMILLGVFLEFKLALWVVVGIATSFLGAFLFLPWLGVSINIISMFAFIISLGIVVDDAIVAGENIYEYRQRGMNFVTASIRGARNVAIPITYSILTNIIAFLPLAFVPGFIGKIWKVIPFVVASVFIISWIEALWILPSHLAHSRRRSRNAVFYFLHERQQAFSSWFRSLVENRYAPLLDWSMRWRYLTMAAALCMLLVVISWALSGRMGFILMPKVEADRSVVTAQLPFGSPLQDAVEVREKLEEAARRVVAEHGEGRLSEGIFTVIEENQIETTLYLTEPGVRPLSTGSVTSLWREEVGRIPGVESMRFEADRGGPGRGPALTVEISHHDIAVLDRASEDLAGLLEDYPEVRDVNDGYSPGKKQLDFTIVPEGYSLGFTSREIARQVRYAFYGAEALRQQRGRNEVKVMVSYPERERRSEYDVENLLLRTPGGGEVPLVQVATVESGRAYTSIERRQGRRTVTISGDVEPIAETSRILQSMRQEILPQLVQDYPGLSFSFEGRQASFRESMVALRDGLILSLICIFILLAIPFQSYIQPLIVMVAIPFGVIGAIIGHLMMGYSLSIISFMGIIALSGVVVNDSLIMIDYANRQRRRGVSAFASIHRAGVRRFRPILLTTLTTFGGLAPMIFETSRQARFMIPMAISLGYGLLFATFILLLIVPSLYLIVEDGKRLLGLEGESQNPQAATGKHSQCDR